MASPIKQQCGGEQKAYHHGDLRNACIKAAMELIEDGGLSRVTLRGVSEQIGVSRSAPYRHFRNKRDLLAACAAEGFRKLERSLKESIATAGSNPVDQFFAGSLAYARFGSNHPELYRLMFSSNIGDSEYPEIAETSGASFQVPVDLLTAAQADGSVKHAYPRLQAFALWSALHGVVNLHIDSRPSHIFDGEALEDNVNGIIAVLWQGLSAHPTV